jgi:hypothetical protein
MQRSGTRLFPLFLVLIIVIVVIVAIVSIGRAIFFSGSQTTTTDADTNTGRTELLTTTADHSVRMTVRGPIVADEKFKSYQITISQSARTMVVYRGYLDEEERTKQLDNNRAAYEQFVYALDKANMMKGTMPEDDAENDLRGVCATGHLYEYSVLVADEPVKHLWTSTCDGSKGSLEASVNQLNDLFLVQIPGSEDLVPFSSSNRLVF